MPFGTKCYAPETTVARHAGMASGAQSGEQEMGSSVKMYFSVGPDLSCIKETIPVFQSFFLWVSKNQAEGNLTNLKVKLRVLLEGGREYNSGCAPYGKRPYDRHRLWDFGIIFWIKQHNWILVFVAQIESFFLSDDEGTSMSIKSLAWMIVTKKY